MRSTHLLELHAGKATLVAIASVLPLTWAAGAVRLLPWLLAPQVPLGVAWIFARALLAGGLETSLVVAIPLGFCWAAVGMVSRGEACALHAMGASPTQLVAGTLRLLVVLSCCLLGASYGWGAQLRAPGEAARALVEEGRSECRPGRAVQVPLVNVTWLCLGNGERWVAGQPPRAQGVVFASRELLLSDDLQSLTLTGVQLVVPERDVSATFRHLQVSGLSPWGSASPLSPRWRGILLVFSTCLATLLASWCALRAALRSVVAALALGLTGPLFTLGALAFLDRHRATLGYYVLLPLFAALAVTLLGWALGSRLPAICWGARSRRGVQRRAP